MGRIVVMVIGLGLTLSMAWFYLQTQAGPTRPGGHSAPRDRIDQMKEKKVQIEDDAQKRADEMFEKTAPP